jgi:CheY-like chemotaxis protein
VTDGVADQVAGTEVQHVAQPRSATILLVDDEKLVRAATAEMLRGMGHEVITTSSPAEALAQLKSDAHFDLLISDYLMPQMRGSALIEEARRSRPGLKALLITGYSNLAEGEAQGIARLPKPFREADLAREVARLISENVVALDSRRPTGAQSG